MKKQQRQEFWIEYGQNIKDFAKYASLIAILMLPWGLFYGLPAPAIGLYIALLIMGFGALFGRV